MAAVPGRAHVFTIRILNTTSAPTARVVKLDPTGQVLEVQESQEMVELDGPNSDIWGLEWEVPAGVMRETHMAIVTALVGSLTEKHAIPADINLDMGISTAVAGTDRKILAGFLADLIPIIRRGVRRLVQAGLGEIPNLEVDGITTSVSSKTTTQGDTPLVSGTIFVAGTQVPRDIKGATVKFRIEGEPSVGVVFDRTCNIVDDVGGGWDVRLTVADTATSGTFTGEVEVTFPNGEILTSPPFTYSIRGQIA